MNFNYIVKYKRKISGFGYNYHMNEKKKLLLKKVKENKYVRKTKKGIGSLVFSRTGLFAFLIISQIFIIYGLYRHFAIDEYWLLGGSSVISFLMMLVILNLDEMNPYMKLSWSLFIFVAPPFALLAFLMAHFRIGYRRIHRRVLEIEADASKNHHQAMTKEAVENTEDKRFINLTSYLKNTGGFPVYNQTRSEYYKLGDDMFKAMIKDIRKAESFIFMEFFILDYGYMWGSILEELVKKVNQGVEVRLLIDGSNLITRLHSDFEREMEDFGIKFRVFSKMYPIISTYLNNRDHRKVMVVDGRWGYTGGINLADEYINRYERFGHWKDCGLRLEGLGVDALTNLFLTMWNAAKHETVVEDYNKYLVAKPIEDHDGYYVAFSDNPTDDERLCQNIFLDMVNNARDYVYAMTPYFIVDNEIISALQAAAKKGLDVRICIPHIPDKKVAFNLAKTHFAELIKYGVKIYEYTPGFVHSKTWLADGKIGMVGTINLDYRALFQNFECGVLIYKSKSLETIKEDFDEFFQVSQLVTEEEVKNMKLRTKLAGALLKPFAPLM